MCVDGGFWFFAGALPRRSCGTFVLFPAVVRVCAAASQAAGVHEARSLRGASLQLRDSKLVIASGDIVFWDSSVSVKVSS